MWDLPRSGIKLVSSTLAGKFLTSGPPGKSQNLFFLSLKVCILDQHLPNPVYENTRELIMPEKMGQQLRPQRIETIHRIHLPMLSTQFDPWSGKIPHALSKPMRHNYWARALEPESHNYWSLHHLGPKSQNWQKHCAAATKARVPRARVLHEGEGIAIRSLCTTSREQPPLFSTRESLSAAMKTQQSQK